MEFVLKNNPKVRCNLLKAFKAVFVNVVFGINEKKRNKTLFLPTELIQNGQKVQSRSSFVSFRTWVVQGGI